MFILIACSFWTGVHWMKDVVTDAAANLIPMSAEEGATLSSSKRDFQQNYNETVIDIPHGPIQALARRVHHILTNSGLDENLICDYMTEKGTWQTITAADMQAALRHTVKQAGLQHHGIDPDLVGVHSLRAGGAMAMKLHGCGDTTIMKQGRWTSLTFLMYIHSQIAHLGKDISTKMSTPLPFTNIAKIENPITPSSPARPRDQASVSSRPHQLLRRVTVSGRVHPQTATA